ncbi:MAG: DUF3155 domain-containing protein [Aphanocapsa lilacina HA4352-LM1]|uniref:DUF3155 domain-containing protein n=1 Tax=Gloeobacter morelensis MG652769 TaxID=2781736 RepID=A0ABY3PHE2_9CYAN|nr:DUF3155 domain-containing protein [Gloeobacter morelensis]MBW4699953.1 DUF3155 domain-containing protein [Aphanocapsa lilacina HA4352-LM1]UFP93088.1 DUF3155 domain-containing protein [Gloeobacter morelensis MG652769]
MSRSAIPADRRGRQLLKQIPQFRICCSEDKPVTAARRFVQENNIVPPAVIAVQRNQQAAERFFWSTRGLFGARYAEEHYFLFPSLVAIVHQQANAGEQKVG